MATNERTRNSHDSAPTRLGDLTAELRTFQAKVARHIVEIAGDVERSVPREWYPPAPADVPDDWAEVSRMLDDRSRSNESTRRAFYEWRNLVVLNEEREAANIAAVLHLVALTRHERDPIVQNARRVIVEYVAREWPGARVSRNPDLVVDDRAELRRIGLAGVRRRSEVPAWILNGENAPEYVTARGGSMVVGSDD